MVGEMHVHLPYRSCNEESQTAIQTALNEERRAVAQITLTLPDLHWLHSRPIHMHTVNVLVATCNDSLLTPVVGLSFSKKPTSQMTSRAQGLASRGSTYCLYCSVRIHMIQTLAPSTLSQGPITQTNILGAHEIAKRVHTIPVKLPG